MYLLHQHEHTCASGKYHLKIIEVLTKH